jgi:hypothetical protein
MVEMLESRRLLSATATVAPAAAMYGGGSGGGAVTAAATTVPMLTGSAYTGTSTASDGTTSDITISVSTESKSGKLAGTITAITGSTTTTYTFSGSVNKKGTFTLKGNGGGHKTLSVKGAVSADTNTLTGTFKAAGKHNSSHGTFTASR